MGNPLLAVPENTPIPVLLNAKDLGNGVWALQVSDSESASLVEAIEAMHTAVHTLTRTIGLMQPDTAARMRVAVDAITAGLTLAAVTTVTTVTTLTNQSQIGGFAANDQIPALMRMGVDSLRRNIEVS